jgi:3',5'-cyclic AMP phosphodiesterase CpdA
LKLRAGVLLFLFFFVLFSCSTAKKLLKNAEYMENIDYPEVKFIVFADPHILAPELMRNMEDSSELFRDEAKMVCKSPELMNAFVKEAVSIDADFVIVCGDLTYNGEKLSHLAMAEYLNILEESGKKVFVVPGNHDIQNNCSSSFSNEQKEPAPTVSPEEFKDIYSSFGYSEALLSDPDSLSYVVEPVQGLWIICMDSCMYRENKEKPLAGGMFYSETLEWIVEVLKNAHENGKSVIGVMHHGILEHYEGQSRYYEDFVINDYENISRLFASYGMKLVFTGHYHAQDIVFKAWDEKYLFDIETGSFVTYSSPYRIVKISGSQLLSITSRSITEIETVQEDFLQYAYNYQAEKIASNVKQVLVRYFVKEEDADYISFLIAEAAIAHFAGDEHIEKEIVDFSRINRWSGFVVSRRLELLKALWNDPWPPDNNLEIDLNRANWDVTNF